VYKKIRKDIIESFSSSMVWAKIITQIFF